MCRNQKIYLIGGASGTGKTVLCRRIAGVLPNLIALDGDLIWSCGNFSPEKTEAFYEFCLELAAEIGNSGMEVAIFHAGAAFPDNFLCCRGASRFSKLQFLHLYCSDTVLEERLRARPEWRESPSSDGFIAAMKEMNSMLRSGADGRVALLDTTLDTPEESAEKILSWIVQGRT